MEDYTDKYVEDMLDTENIWGATCTNQNFHHLCNPNSSSQLQLLTEKEGRGSGESERDGFHRMLPPPPPKTSPTFCKSAKEASRSRRRERPHCRRRLLPLGADRARRRCSSRFQGLHCRSSYGGAGKLHLLHLQLRATVTNCSSVLVLVQLISSESPKPTRISCPSMATGSSFRLPSGVPRPGAELRGQLRLQQQRPGDDHSHLKELHHRLQQPLRVLVTGDHPPLRIHQSAMNEQLWKP